MVNHLLNNEYVPVDVSGVTTQQAEIVEDFILSQEFIQKQVAYRGVAFIVGMSESNSAPYGPPAPSTDTAPSDTGSLGAGEVIGGAAGIVGIVGIALQYPHFNACEDLHMDCPPPIIQS
jgi:hypothetical protein